MVSSGVKSDDARASVSWKPAAPSSGPSIDSTNSSRNVGAYRSELGEPLRVGDHRFGAGILQPVVDRVDTEQDGERQRDRGELVDRDMGGRDLRRLRQQDRDAVAAGDAVRAQDVGEAVGGLFQRAVAGLFNAAVRAGVKQRKPAGFAIGPAVAHVDADVIALRHLPAERAIKRAVVMDIRKHGSPGAPTLWTSTRQV